MKYTFLIFGLITIAVISIACNRKSPSYTSQESGVVVFPDAGVSIDIGDGWKRIDINPGLPVCPPTLVGSAGMVRAMLFAPNVSDMQAATNALHAMFENSSDAIKDSFHQEAFTTDNGLTGQHISYTGKSEKNGTVAETRSHNFIVQRKDGRCVSISYIATANADSDAVRQMIQKSLKLQ